MRYANKWFLKRHEKDDVIFLLKIRKQLFDDDYQRFFLWIKKRNTTSANVAL